MASVKVTSANDNCIRKFEPYFIESSNIGKPSQPVDLNGLLNVLKSMKGKKNE